MKYSEFWPQYLEAHSKTSTKVFHLLGIVLASVVTVAAFIVTDGLWVVLFFPLVGYSFAFIGHAFCQGNRPETFRHPFYSLPSDFRMCAWLLRGKFD